MRRKVSFFKASESRRLKNCEIVTLTKIARIRCPIQEPICSPLLNNTRFDQLAQAAAAAQAAQTQQQFFLRPSLGNRASFRGGGGPGAAGLDGGVAHMGTELAAVVMNGAGLGALSSPAAGLGAPESRLAASRTTSRISHNGGGGCQIGPPDGSPAVSARKPGPQGGAIVRGASTAEKALGSGDNGTPRDGSGGAVRSSRTASGGSQLLSRRDSVRSFETVDTADRQADEAWWRRQVADSGLVDFFAVVRGGANVVGPDGVARPEATVSQSSPKQNKTNKQTNKQTNTHTHTHLVTHEKNTYPSKIRNLLPTPFPAPFTSLLPTSALPLSWHLLARALSDMFSQGYVQLELTSSSS